MVDKKICFVTVRNIYSVPSLPRYKKLFGEVPFDIIYWDRHLIDETCGADKYYPFKYSITSKDSKWKKLKGYFRFIKFAIKIINKNKYYKLILLPTHTGVLLYPFMDKSYYGNYVIDIRDYTAERNKFFNMIERSLIKNSGLAVITSPSFKKFLPQHDYLISHNITEVSSKLVKKYRSEKEEKPRIIISCIGAIRFYEQFKRVLLYFKNDNRYLLRFIGQGAEELEEFCVNNKIQNVELVGRFDSDETVDFYMDSDIIMNLYGNKNPFLDYALSNKLYYAAIFGMPILVCSDTYMEEVSYENGFGFTFDLNDTTMSDKLYKYYQAINWKEFYNNCDNFMNMVYEDERLFSERIGNFFD